MAVTHEMEKNVIAALLKLQLAVVVAPYEADPQLVYLCHRGICQAIMTEDSDVLVYSAIIGKSVPILYKFDKASQMVQCIDIENIFRPMDEEASPSVISFNGSAAVVAGNGKESSFTKNIKHFAGHRGRRMFVQMCVLAGCDYCDSIHGVGIVTAQQAVIRFKHHAHDQRLERICDHFQISCKKSIPESYLQRIQRAEALFHYHIVYDPRNKALAHFSSPQLLQVQQHEADAWRAPYILRKDLASLGSDTLQELLRDCHVQGQVTAEKLCLGMVSIKDYSIISPKFPWDNPALQYPQQQRLSASNSKSNVSYIWSHRRSLMQHSKSIQNRVVAGAPASSSMELHATQTQSSSYIGHHDGNTIATPRSFESLNKFLYHGSSNSSVLSTTTGSISQSSVAAHPMPSSARVPHQSPYFSSNQTVDPIHAVTEQGPSLPTMSVYESASANQPAVATMQGNQNPFKRPPLPSMLKNRPPLRISTNHSSLAVAEIITIIDDEDDQSVADLSPSSSQMQSESSQQELSLSMDTIMSQTTPTAGEIINLLNYDNGGDEALASVYDAVLSPDTKPTVISSESVICDEIQTRNQSQSQSQPLQPINLNKRKFVEITIPNPTSRSSISGVKRIKSSCTTMKLPSITSYFPSLSSMTKKSADELL
jgi:5'-3' exonuclease